MTGRVSAAPHSTAKQMSATAISIQAVLEIARIPARGQSRDRPAGVAAETAVDVVVEVVMGAS